MLKKIALGLTLAVAPLVAASAQTAPTPAPQNIGNAAQEAAIASDPAFVYQPLRLMDLPRPTGPKVALFNGKNLDNWDAWLGYKDPALTYRNPPEAPIGMDGVGDVYKVVTVDGAPAIQISGVTWGGLVHKGDFSNYHLRLEYKWGTKTYAPRLNRPQNNGLLYHSHGAFGGTYGTWMSSAEFEIMKGSVGMFVPVGNHVRARMPVGTDATIIYPRRRYMPGGTDIEVTQPAWNVEASIDVEKPVGEWNTIDLNVLGDKAVYVVNGVPVLYAYGLSTVDAAGKRTALTHGRIQVQSEGAETYFRNITLEPIKALPRLVSK